MDQAREFLMHYEGTKAYATFFFIIMGCGMGMPFNSDLCLIAASVLAALGYFDLKILMVLAWVALLTGDSFTFFVGRRYGKRLLKVRPFSWLFTEAKIAQAENFLNTRGNKFLFLVRFLPLVRTVLFFTAGSLRVRPKTFYVMDASATAIYLPLLMITAYTLSENIEQVVAEMKRFQFGILGILIAVALTFYVKKKSRKSVTSA